jgi:hypothetical protein
MGRRRVAVIVVAGLVLAAAGTVLCAPSKAPVFRCDWDTAGTFTPDQAAGSRDVTKVGADVASAEGKIGRGILCRGKDPAVDYPLRGNLNLRQGTIEYWFYPSFHGVGATYSNQHNFVFAFVPGQTIAFHVGCTANGSLCLYVLKDWKQNILNGSCWADWAAGEWHHVAITWDDHGGTMYLDAQAKGKVTRDLSVPLPEAAEGTLSIGGHPHAAADSIIDQLRIYDYPRDAATVRADYESEAEIAAELVLPDRVPALVYPDETAGVKVTNYSKRARQLELGYEVTDLSRPEYVMKRRGARNLPVPPGGSVVETVYVPAKEKQPFGLLELKATVREKGKLVAARTRSFGAAPRPVDLHKTPDSPFGTWSEGCHVSGIRSQPGTSLGPAALLGHKWHRTIFGWHAIEGEPGKFDWSAPDAVVESARKTGVSLMPCLFGTPRWASSAPPGLTDEQLRALGAMDSTVYVPKPENMKDWDNYVFQVVSRYKRYVKYWNIWNEPLGGWFLTGWDATAGRNVRGGSPEEARLYFDMCKIASLAAKRADPEAKIVIEPSWGAWTQALLGFNGGEIHKLVDVFAWHFYSAPEPPEAVINRMREFTRPVREAAGKPIHVWDTEGGIALAVKRTNRPMTRGEILEEVKGGSPGYQWMHYAFDEWTQADRTVRDYLVKWGEGIEKVFSGSYADFQCGPNVCSWRDRSPVVSALATNVLTRMLTGAEFVRKLDVPGDHYAYLFRQGNDYIVACWTTLDRSSLILDAKKAVVTVTDLFGNDRAEKSEKGVVGLTVTPTPIYVRHVGAEVKALPEKLKVAAGAPLVSAGTSVAITVEVTNSTDAALKGEVTLRVPSGWEATPKSASVACVAKEVKRLPFKVTPPVGTPDGIREVSAILSEGARTTTKTAQVMVKTAVPCPRMSSPPVIDGDLSEWPGMNPMRIDRREQVKVGVVSRELEAIQPFVAREDLWKGPSDCSGDICTAWDDRCLYIAANVTDDDVVHLNRFKVFFQGDCLEFFADLGAMKPSPGQTSGKVFQIYFIPPDAAFPHPTWGVHQGVVTLTGVEVGSKRTETGYTLEIALPWINLPGFSPVDGALMGADFAINDSDMNHGQGLAVKSKLVWHGVEKNFEMTEFYGLLKLAR